MKRKRFFSLVFVLVLMSIGTFAADITIGTGTSSWAYPLFTAFQDTRTQTIYLASEIGTARKLYSLALDVTTIPGQALNYFTIRLKHTDLSSFSTSSGWESAGWTVVYQANQTVSAAGWNTFTFTTPFFYNGTQNLMVDISYNNSSVTSPGYCRYTSSTVNRSICLRANSEYGDPLTWANRTPAPNVLVNYFTNIRLSYAMTTVPAIVGMEQTAAQAALASAELLSGSVSYTFNTSIPAGTVISQTPAAGQSVLAGSSISYVVSAGVYYSGGGTAANPYLITNKWNLLGMGSATMDYSKFFVLTADIDLEGQIFTDSIIKWALIKQPPYTLIFTGTFDGNGHCIKNFAITAPLIDYVGLFGNVGNNGVIKNLGVENVNILGRSYVGGLAGYMTGTLSNCHSTGSVSSSNTQPTGLLMRVISLAGGLAGYGAGVLTNCYSTCSVSSFASTPSASDELYSGAGGLVGESFCAFNNCYSTGSVTLYAYSLASFSSYSYAGGLAGSQGFNTITNCYSTGLVTASGNSYVLKGGLIGSGSSVINSFWDMQTSGLTSSAGGTGKTTAEMMTFSTFADAGWDFSVADGDGADWYLPVESYPLLKWQLDIVVPDVTGMPLEDARATIISAGLLVRGVSVEYSDTVPAGSVIRQSPAAGQLVSGITEVNLFQSLGVEPAYGGGHGTMDEPYQIWTAEQMNILGMNWLQWNKHYILMADIDMSAYAAPSCNIIGTASTKFKGTFDGNGHVISNFTYIQPSATYAGLFGIIDSTAQIKNLRAENVHIEGRNYAGGLVGWNQGSVTSCGTSGFVSGNGQGGYIGGLVGSNGGGVIQFCCSTADVTGTGLYQYIGGLTGISDKTIYCCYATGSVSGAGNYIGGLAGYADGAISTCYSTGAVDGTGGYAGGFIGYNFANIKSCFWDVEASGMNIGIEIGNRGVTGKMTAEMKMFSTFTSAGWDFVGETANGTEDIWFMRDGMEYPCLVSLNQTPIADAGEDITAYLGFEGSSAEVTLDGSGSSDADGDTLTYKWYWDETVLAEGVSPTVSLPAGEHMVTLRVNDGIIDSKTDYVLVNVVGPVWANMRITPSTFSINGSERFVWAILDLPDGITLIQLDRDFGYFMLPGNVSPMQFWHINGARPQVIARFEREQLRPYLDAGRMRLTFYGRLNDGRYIGGYYRVWVIILPEKTE